MKTSRFADSLAQGNSLSPSEVARILREQGVKHITAVAFRPSVALDKLGVDYIAYRDGNREPLFIDLKETSYCSTDCPCVLLETARCGRTVTAGWATDSSKRTDLFLFQYGDGAALVLSARQVRAALNKHGDEWSRRYRTGCSDTVGFYETYRTEYILVPRDVLTSTCAQIAADWRHPPHQANTAEPRNSDGTLRSWFTDRINGLREESNRPSPLVDENMSLDDLEQLEERLVDEIVSGGWRDFPRPPIAGLAGLIEPLTDYAALKSHELRTNNDARWYTDSILSGVTYVYAMELPEPATLVVTRSKPGAPWQFENIVGAHGRAVRAETRGLAVGWLAARTGLPPLATRREEDTALAA